MKTAARIDENQPEIVKALRGIGCTVQSLAAVGGGCADILVGFRGTNYLFEIKNPDKPPSQRRLTADQVQWHGQWFGQVNVIETVEDAIHILRSDRKI